MFEGGITREAESEGQCLRGVLLGRQNLRGSF